MSSCEVRAQSPGCRPAHLSTAPGPLSPPPSAHRDPSPRDKTVDYLPGARVLLAGDADRLSQRAGAVACTPSLPAGVKLCRQAQHAGKSIRDTAAHCSNTGRYPGRPDHYQVPGGTGLTTGKILPAFYIVDVDPILIVVSLRPARPPGLYYPVG